MNQKDILAVACFGAVFIIIGALLATRPFSCHKMKHNATNHSRNKLYKITQSKYFWFWVG
jgi:hypothetical protein